MQNITSRTVREIAIELPQTTRVFEQHKIDYCCGGRKPFLDACRKAGAEPETVLREIEAVINDAPSEDMAWIATASAGRLADYIVEKHHAFTDKELENLPPLMNKVALVHGGRHEELIALRDIFAELRAELGTHLKKEEIVLFPYIRSIDPDYPSQNISTSACFGAVENPVRMMMMEHDSAGDLLARMREVSDNYALPADACPSYGALFSRLRELEADLHQHIHLENNLLFPKAIELESGECA